MNILKQAWWAPVALVLAAAELWLAGAILLDRGTATTQDTVVGAALALAGAAALLAGLWARPHARGRGDALIIVGAALAAIWLWTLFMSPLAVVVIIGTLVDRARTPNPAPTTT